MKENFQAELKGDGQSYVDKLEENMLKNAEKAPESESQPNQQIAIVDGSKLIKQASKEQNGDIIQLRYDIKAHFDVVREMFYLEQMHVLASVSEDCQVHLWNLKNIATDSDKIISPSENLHLESYQTLRGHKGPLYAITGINGIGG